MDLWACLLLIYQRDIIWVIYSGRRVGGQDNYSIHHEEEVCVRANLECCSTQRVGGALLTEILGHPCQGHSGTLLLA